MMTLLHHHILLYHAVKAVPRSYAESPPTEVLKIRSATDHHTKFGEKQKEKPKSRTKLV